MYSRNPKEFLRSVVIVDETWIHYTRAPRWPWRSGQKHWPNRRDRRRPVMSSSNQKWSRAFLRPQKIRRWTQLTRDQERIKSVGWTKECEGVSVGSQGHGFFGMHAVSFSSIPFKRVKRSPARWWLLDRFDMNFNRKRPHLSKKKEMFHQDNARLHTNVAALSKFGKLGY